jgi:hypothetical protein
MKAHATDAQKASRSLQSKGRAGLGRESAHFSLVKTQALLTANQ